MAGGAGLLRYDLRGGRIRRLRLPPRGLSAADEPRMKVPSLQTTAIAAAVLLCAGFALAFFYAPLDADQGFVQKIFYVHVPLAICALVGFIVGGIHDPPPAEWRPGPRRALLRVDPPVDHLRGRRADHRRDLGPRLLGQVVGLGGADPRELPDRLPPLRDLLPVALRDRGPRPPGALRVGVRDHGGSLRAAQLHRRPDGGVPRPSARLR